MQIGDSDDVDSRRRAALQLEAALTGRLPTSVDAGPYLSRIVSLQQIASERIGCVMSRTGRLVLSARRARALAFAARSLVCFLESCVTGDGPLDVQFVLGNDPDGATLALGAVGDISPVGTASGTLALVRARALLVALGAEFQRGWDAQGRMVFGAILPDR